MRKKSRKKDKLIIFLIVSLLFTACSNSDDNSTSAKADFIDISDKIQEMNEDIDFVNSSYTKCWKEGGMGNNANPRVEDCFSYFEFLIEKNHSLSSDRKRYFVKVFGIYEVYEIENFIQEYSNCYRAISEKEIEISALLYDYEEKYGNTEKLQLLQDYHDASYNDYFYKVDKQGVHNLQGDLSEYQEEIENAAKRVETLKDKVESMKE